MKIGVLKKAYYCEKRNVTDRVNERAQRASYCLIKRYDVRACMGIAADKLLKKLRHRGMSPQHGNRLRDYYHPLLTPPVDVIHTCNVICETKKPWIVTFEGALPLGLRMEDTPAQRAWVQRCYEQMASPSCKKLLAFSQWAADCTRDWMRRNGCEQFDAIDRKIEVLYPPQQVQVTRAEIEEKFRDVNQELRFVFVGRDFYRKGMYECLQALCDVRKTFPVHLTLISGLAQGYSYRVPKYGKAEEAAVQRLLQENANWIDFHQSLPNEQVLALCKRAHVGLLPTYRDSFGYSVIEMQSCGCTVLSTDVFALPELNNPTIGYVCHIRDVVEALTDDDDAAIQALKHLLARELRRVLPEIVAERASLAEKAIRAMEQVARQHDPTRHGERLYQLYQECVKEHE